MAKNENFELRQNPENLNQGTERGVGLIEHSIQTLGAARSGVAANNGEMIAGNHTLNAVIAAGIPIRTVETDGSEWIVVKRTDLPTARTPKAMELGLADNITAQRNLSIDIKGLLERSQDVNAEKYFTDAELKELIKQANKEQKIELPEELDRKLEDNLQGKIDKNQLEIRCKVGEVWALGKHRLAVGDSTDADLMFRLMDGESADLLFTDPPFNTREQQGRSAKRWGKIKNDDLTIDGFIAILKASKDISDALLKPEAHRYVCCDWGSYPYFFEAYSRPTALIVWAKNNFGLGKGYRPQHEFIMFFGPDFKSEKESNLWEVSREQDAKHPMQKPTQLIIRALQNSTEPGQTVLDLFAGSGSVLMASQFSDRVCRCAELDTRYATVIIERFEAITGLTAHTI